LSQLGGGLSHEVRNPLHVLRINLHTLRRALGGKGSLQESHIRDTLVESDAAISRLDALMRDLLQFTDPAAASEPTELNVCREIQLIAELLQADLTRRQIELCTALPANPALVAIDPVRLRQMLLNVLTFAQHRSGQPGRIAVEVAVADGNVQILVTDSGQPLQPEQAAHVFEPFQAPVETGSGLGLALVQTYAEASGGRVALEQPGPTGNRLRISLPLAATHPGELIA
jgi:signal transduction histidine kinase